MNSELPAVSLSKSREKSISRALSSFLLLVLGLGISGASGFVLANYLENRRDYEMHAALLTPLLRYEERVSIATKRGSNETMRLVCFHLYLARAEGLDIGRFIDLAQPPEVIPPSLAALNKARFLSNLDLCDHYGLFTPDNLERLGKGEAPYVTKGDFTGQKAEVEHIIPVSVAPNMDNLLCNLEWLPRSLNASKGDTITDQSTAFAEKALAAGIMNAAEYRKVQIAFKDQ